MKQKLRVIGIDPGLRHTGWGVVEAAGSKLSHVAHGVISATGDDLALRLHDLRMQLSAVFIQWSPESAAVEHTFVNKDAVGTLKLAHARAIALLVPAENGVPVAEYAPNAIKKAVVGVGHADKAQVAHMVAMLLPGANVKKADAVDALAAAICHAHRAPALDRMKAVAR
jgi:crossover junction endodeoxyribonuclease RuvC